MASAATSAVSASQVMLATDKFEDDYFAACCELFGGGDSQPLACALRKEFSYEVRLRKLQATEKESGAYSREYERALAVLFTEQELKKLADCSASAQQAESVAKAASGAMAVASAYTDSTYRQFDSDFTEASLEYKFATRKHPERPKGLAFLQKYPLKLRQERLFTIRTDVGKDSPIYKRATNILLAVGEDEGESIPESPQAVSAVQAPPVLNAKVAGIIAAAMEYQKTKTVKNPAVLQNCAVAEREHILAQLKSTLGKDEPLVYAALQQLFVDPNYKPADAAPVGAAKK